MTYYCSKIAAAAGVLAILALAGAPSHAQQPAGKQPAAGATPAPTLKPASPAALGFAKEILAMRNAGALYASAVPNSGHATKNASVQSNLNSQKELGEVAIIVAKTVAGREQETGEGVDKIYATEFTEQELKDLVPFSTSPLGHK